MRILYFHQYFATRESATATRSLELARRLVERGHEVTVVSSIAALPQDGGPGRGPGGSSSATGSTASTSCC